MIFSKVSIHFPGPKPFALFIALVLIISFSFSLAAQTRTDVIILSGKQIRGSMDRKGKIIGKAITLKHPAAVIRVDGGKDGFCITGTAIICSGEELIGTKLKPGTYSVFPNVPEGKDEDTVIIYLR
jgi:hypothetical protein